MSEKSFLEFLAESVKDYKYRIKIACNQITEEDLDSLEATLNRYELRGMTPFKETPIQESPLDFPNIKHSRVFISDIVIGYPATVELLNSQVSNSMDISQQQVAVYNENDPRQENTDRWLMAEEAPKHKDEYEPYINKDYESNVDARDYHGETYISNFLKELNDKRTERKTTIVTNKLVTDQVVDHAHLESSTSKVADAKSDSLFSGLKNAFKRAE